MLDRRLVGIPAKEPEYHSIFNAQAWAAMNLEANAFAELPAHSWDISKWRTNNG